MLNLIDKSNVVLLEYVAFLQARSLIWLVSHFLASTTTNIREIPEAFHIYLLRL